MAHLRPRELRNSHRAFAKRVPRYCTPTKKGKGSLRTAGREPPRTGRVKYKIANHVPS